MRCLNTHTKQGTAVDKSLRHQEMQISPEKSSNLSRLGEKRECYLFAMPTPGLKPNESDDICSNRIRRKMSSELF